MPDSTTRAIVVKIDKETRERIERLAESRKRTSHWVLTEAISQYLEREEKCKSFRKAAMNAWHECQATRLHVHSDEVTAWLENWGDEDELPVSSCRH